MIDAYYSAKHFIVFTLAAIILLLIAQKELDWATQYVETTARIARIDQTCADGRGGRVRYVECDKALPGASRRTVLELRYISPADGREHRATVRCDTSAEETPRLLIGEGLAVLAHESEPERMDRRRCTSIAARTAPSSSTSQA